ncbi:DUF3139 domain-containing protein [Paenibacillus terrigena]|uniref:DUF3139 domain-containing protein n=1 Tax=Paenibacillus terrigena TaxID=369333 RepID=UPI0028D37F6A|nr:DUF3139 domain-containing protein [Paenibacillus terrigena]
MMKKRTTIMSLSLIIIIIIGISIYFGIFKPPIDNKEVKKEMVEHLLGKGQSQEKYELKISYSWENKLFSYNHNPYVIKVVFKDEPDVIYHYTYYYQSEIKEVIQIGVSPISKREDKNFRHVE